MLIYWLFFGVLAGGALLTRINGVHPNRVIWLVGFACVALLGLRWGIGPDFRAYQLIYKTVSMFRFEQILSREDVGFYIVAWCLRSMHAPFWALNVVCAGILINGLTRFCLRQANPWLAFVVAFPYLVIVVGMSGDRQSAALGFLFLALNAIQRGLLLRFILLVLVGATFHGSVCIMIPVGLLAYPRSGLQTFALLVLGLALSIYTAHDSFVTYAQRYSSAQIQSEGVWLRLTMNIFAAVMFLTLRRRLDFPLIEDKLWRNFSFCTLALIPILIVSPSSTAVDRLLLYFFPLQFAVASRSGLIAVNRMTSGQITIGVILYAAAMQAVFLSFGTFASFYVPYESIFSKTFSHPTITRGA